MADGDWVISEQCGQEIGRIIHQPGPLRLAVQQRLAVGPVALHCHVARQDGVEGVVVGPVQPDRGGPCSLIRSEPRALEVSLTDLIHHVAVATGKDCRQRRADAGPGIDAGRGCGNLEHAIHRAIAQAARKHVRIVGQSKGRIAAARVADQRQAAEIGAACQPYVVTKAIVTTGSGFSQS